MPASLTVVSAGVPSVIAFVGPARFFQAVLAEMTGRIIACTIILLVHWTYVLSTTANSAVLSIADSNVGCMAFPNADWIATGLETMLFLVSRSRLAFASLFTTSVTAMS
jgi:hypothetical protein